MKLGLSGDTNQQGMTYILGIVALNFTSSFIHLNNSKTNKYNLIYSRYNELQNSQNKLSPQETISHQISLTALALDIMHFDMWAHKSFREFLILQVANAINTIQQHLEDLREHTDIGELFKIGKDSLISEINCSRISEEQIVLILDYFLQLKQTEWERLSNSSIQESLNEEVKRLKERNELLQRQLIETNEILQKSNPWLKKSM